MDEIALDASDPAMITAIEDNIAAHYRYLGSMPSAEMHAEQDLTWFATSIPDRGLNGVIQTRLAPNASAVEIGSRIDELAATFAARALPMVWWVTPSTTPADLATYLVARGFSPVGSRPGMAIELDTLPQQIPHVPEIEIKTVTDASTYEAWVRIFAACYGHRPEIAQRYFELTSPRIADNETDVRHYIAWQGTTPVAISTLFVSDDVAGLYHVGTLPEARGHGLGTAIALAALLEARSRGLRHAVLYSSAMGVNIYCRLGFKVYCRLDRYVLTPH